MATKKKGLSMEEKKQRLYELFLERKEAFQFKELEKIAPKEKGIVAQSVKDVLQMLVDDGLVESDKIGTLVCFWAFPTKAVTTRKRKLFEITNEIESLRVKEEKLQKQLTVTLAGKEKSEEREILCENLLKIEAERDQLLMEVGKFQDFDPVQLESRREDAKMAKVSANRWTDNIFSIKSWCEKKYQIEESVINKQFGIPTDIDYID